MARFSDVNNTCSGPDAIYRLKEVLKAAGWVVQNSSDGSTYNASGDQISHSESGANGMENNYAWFVIRDPGDSHEWCFQRGTTNPSWRVKISSLDRHTGGSPDANQTPSATDEQIILGSGTDASPGFTTLFYTDNYYRFNIVAESTPIGTAVPIYGFCAFAIKIGTSTGLTLIMQEPMAIGSFPELSSGTRTSPVIGDPDPVVYACRYQSSGQNFICNGTIDNGASWCDPSPDDSPGRYHYRMNYGDEVFISCHGVFYFTYSYLTGVVAPPTASSGCGVSPHGGQDYLLPFIVGRTSYNTYAGMKGVCNNIKLKTINKNFPDTVDLATDAKIYVGDLIIPWPNNVLPR